MPAHPWEEWDDAVWIAGIRDHDSAVEDALSRYLLERAGKLGTRYKVKDRENLMQEAVATSFFRIRDRIDTYSGRGRFLHWAAVILSRALSDHLRGLDEAEQDRSLNLEIGGRPAFTPVEPSTVEEQADVGELPELPDPTRLDALRDCMARLSEREHAAILADAPFYEQVQAALYHYRLRWQREEQRAREAGAEPNPKLRPPLKFDLPERRRAYEDVADQFQIDIEPVYRHVKTARKKLQTCMAQKGFFSP